MTRINRRRCLGAPALMFALGVAAVGLIVGTANAHATSPDAAFVGPTPNCNDPSSVLRSMVPADAPADPEVQALLAQLRSGDRDDFEQASKRLSRMGASAIPALAEALFDSDPRMRTSAALTMSWMEPPPAA